MNKTYDGTSTADESVDNVNFEDNFTAEKSESGITYKCPNCEAGLVFDAEKQMFVCNFCLSSFSEDELSGTQAEKKVEREAFEDKDFDESVNQYNCPSCGAEIIVDKSTVADFCYYCHNPVVLSNKISGNYKPTKIIPFKFDKAEAKRIFLEYSRKKWFCPNDYFSEAHSEKICGLYYPFWVTDADTHAFLDTTAYRVRSWTSGGYRYTETSKYDVKREGNIHFEDITTSAISEEDKRMLEGILPYPKNEHIDFSIPYLQGFRAKKRNLDSKDIAREVEGRMHRYSEEILRDTIRTYTRVETDFINVNLINSHWEYTLMPIWVLTYKKGKKTFMYAMNGSTGKIYGELPVSPWKLAVLGVAVAAIAAAIGLLIGGGLL